jgi:hypothetical protein
MPQEIQYQQKGQMPINRSWEWMARNRWYRTKMMCMRHTRVHKFTNLLIQVVFIELMLCVWH